MNNAYKVRFTNYKNGQDEWFFTDKTDAQNYADKFKKYGYTPVVETIYFQEVVAECGCSKHFICFEHMKVAN